MKKIVFFDIDDVIWHPQIQNDYISKIKSDIQLKDEKTLLRTDDNNIFTLDNSVVEGLQYLKFNDIICGIISNNHPDPVIKGLKLLNLLLYFHSDFVQISFNKIYYPKILYIEKLLQKNKVNRDNLKVYFIDDKNYTKDVAQSGITFFQYKKQKLFIEIFKNIFCLP